VAKKPQKRNFQTFWSNIRFKYKLLFVNERTLEEVWVFRLSKLSACASLIAFIIIIIAITAVIIVSTPVRNYLPGYLDVEVRKEIMRNTLRADSLERLIAIQSFYLKNVTGILNGTLPIDSARYIDSLALINANYNIPRSDREEQFVRSFEEKEKDNLTTLDPNHIPSEAVFFYKPVNGPISAHYDTKIRHYGVDLTASPQQNVLATLDGTVIFTGYDAQYGNIIEIQHKNGYVSIYKHNALLLKRMGDAVIGGEAIALIGNTGELSTGPHLHFELWFKGAPVNPEEYIAF